MALPLCLEDGLNDLAVIRAMLETQMLFADDDPIRAELLLIVAEACENFTRRLQALCAEIQAAPEAFQIDYEAFRVYALDAMMRGYPGRSLNRFMKVDVFDEGESSLFYLKAAGIVDMEAAQQMPASDFFVLLLNEVLQSADNEAAYISKTAFDQSVFQKYLLLMLLHYATTDPLFYGIHRGDYKG